MSGPIQVEESGLKFDFRLIEPDRAAWHLRISDLQISTYYVLEKDADVQAVEAALISHLARKVELSRAN